MTYFDGTEGLPDRTRPPIRCPLCRGKLVTKWSASIQSRVRRGYFAIAVPAHTCEKCQITVRVCMLPRRALYATRKAARASVAKELARKNEKCVNVKPFERIA